jgi:crotonobetainyl-CoA:carnitine CoA-transferase CaiB-like acyl-CoA transferase
VINRHIREWANTRHVADIVRDGQALFVPLAKYYAAAEVLHDPHEAARGLFQPVEVPGAGPLDMLVSPFHIDGAPLTLRSGPPSKA